MFHAPSRAPWPITLLGCLALCASSVGAAEINDEVGFFSPAAVRQARDEIREIQCQHHKDVLIDTFKAIPAAKLKQFQALSGTAQDRFFTEWSQERYRTARVDGIAVLICRNPAKIRVTVGQQVLEKAFPGADRDRLVELLLTRFKAREYDQGLLDGVSHVHARLNANLGVSAPRVVGVPAPVANEVKDYAGFFQADAVRKANSAIQALRQRFRQDLVFETFKTVPPSRIEEVERLSTEARGRPPPGIRRRSGRLSGPSGAGRLPARRRFSRRRRLAGRRLLPGPAGGHVRWRGGFLDVRPLLPEVRRTGRRHADSICPRFAQAANATRAVERSPCGGHPRRARGL
jgi:uncharacterized membrane protein YgcG